MQDSSSRITSSFQQPSPVPLFPQQDFITQKKELFERLIAAVNPILLPREKMTLQPGVYNAKQHAIAFLIEHAPTPPETLTPLIEQMIKNVQTLDRKEAMKLLIESVDLALQNAVATKVSPDRKKNYEYILEVYKKNALAAESFGGTAHDLLPLWYYNQYVKVPNAPQS